MRESSERSSMRGDESFLLPMGFFAANEMHMSPSMGLRFVCLGVKESESVLESGRLSG